MDCLFCVTATLRDWNCCSHFAIIRRCHYNIVKICRKASALQMQKKLWSIFLGSMIVKVKKRNSVFFHLTKTQTLQTRSLFERKIYKKKGWWMFVGRSI